MSDTDNLKHRPTNRIPFYGGILGSMLCILISSVCGFSSLFDLDDLREGGLQVVNSALPWLGFLGIFSGPLGAVIGAFVAADLLIESAESRNITHPLFAVLGGILGFTIGFWVPAVLIYDFFVDQSGEYILIAVVIASAVGVLVGSLGATGGVALAKSLLNHWYGV